MVSGFKAEARLEGNIEYARARKEEGLVTQRVRGVQHQLRGPGGGKCLLDGRDLLRGIDLCRGDYQQRCARSEPVFFAVAFVERGITLHTGRGFGEPVVENLVIPGANDQEAPGPQTVVIGGALRGTQYLLQLLVAGTRSLHE